VQILRDAGHLDTTSLSCVVQVGTIPFRFPYSSEMKSGHLESLTIGQRIGIIIVLTLFSIALHEFGHFLVYSLAGVPVHVSLQSVRPIGNVDASLDHWAKFAGSGVSWLAAITFLAIAAKNPGFARTTRSTSTT
jgi:hypothetical protein